MNGPFKLTDIEKQSATWQRISEELTNRLNMCRMKNDGNLTAEETAKLRGTIAAFKEILGWATPTPKITGD